MRYFSWTVTACYSRTAGKHTNIEHQRMQIFLYCSYISAPDCLFCRWMAMPSILVYVQMKLKENHDISAERSRQLQKTTFIKRIRSDSYIYIHITLANSCRLMMKNPSALIDMSKYSICDRSSPFANWILESSAAQNRNFSMFLSNSIFWNKNIRPAWWTNSFLSMWGLPKWCSSGRR